MNIDDITEPTVVSDEEVESLHSQGAGGFNFMGGYFDTEIIIASSGLMNVAAPRRFFSCSGDLMKQITSSHPLIKKVLKYQEQEAKAAIREIDEVVK